MKKQNLTIFILIFVIFTNCSSNKNYSHAPNPYARSVTIGVSGNINKINKTNNNKKIIFSAYLSLTIENPDTVNSRIKQIAKNYGGYVNLIGTHRTIIRVKSDKFNNAVKDISKLGRLDSKSITGEDVTEEFLDYKIRLENAQKARKRYLELLAKAENVEAALKVEKELERLNEKIDLLKGKMNRINHLSEFSTITISLEKRVKPGIVGYVFVGIYKVVKWLFVRN